MAYFLSGAARLRVLAAVLLFCALWPVKISAAQAMLPASAVASGLSTSSSMPLLPYLDYVLDETGTLDVEEAAAPEKSGEYRPLILKALPRESGVVWLRFTLPPLPEGARPATLLLDMGESVPGTPLLYEAATNGLNGAREWRESSPTQRNVLLLPEADAEPLTCYLRLDGLPGLWFAPMLRSPQDAASNLGSLSRTAAILALAVVMLLCLLRGLSEKGQWRVWTALYVAVALAQGLMGMPASGSGHVTPAEAGAVLAPGMALMLLPHVGRHLMRTRSRSRALDMQLLLLSLPGALLALLPLTPGFGWLIRYLDFWPLGTLLFIPTALGAAIMGLGGARRFLLGCLLPPLFVAGGVLGLESGFAANLLASAPLWGTALSALIIAATRSPYEGTAQTEGAAAKSVPTEADGTILLDSPLDDPNLRLVPPPTVMTPGHAAEGAPSPLSDAAPNPPPSAADFPLHLLEDALRQPLDRLTREGTALGHCALPPAVRQYAENMLAAVREMNNVISDPGQLRHKNPARSAPAPFNLQHLMREAHDAVAPAAENAGIGMAWYMPPHLGHMYEGEAKSLRETLCLLLESAVRATRHGAVHFSVRRVPESPDAGHLLFTVTDTGAGIPPEGRSTLALTRAWELAGAHKGFLGLECSPQGATIAFTLHLTYLEQSESDTAPFPAEPLVLIAAGSATDRQTLAHALAPLPCRLIEARSLPDALQENKKEAALVLVAQGQPASPAAAHMLHQFCDQAAAADLPFCKAIAITPDDSQWDQLADAGFTHALLEPLDSEALCRTVREILDAAQAAEQAKPRNEPVQAPAGHSPTTAGTPTEQTDTVTDSEAHDLDNARNHDQPDTPAASQPGRPPLPDLFGKNEDGYANSPLKIPNLTALPDLLSFAESLRTPLPGAPGESASPDRGGLFSGLSKAGDSLPEINLPPADALLSPAVRLPAPRKNDAPPKEISAGLFVNPYAPYDPPVTVTPDHADPISSAEPATPAAEDAVQAEFANAAGLEGPVWSEGDPPATAEEAAEPAHGNDAAPVPSALQEEDAPDGGQKKDAGEHDTGDVDKTAPTMPEAPLPPEAPSPNLTADVHADAEQPVSAAPAEAAEPEAEAVPAVEAKAETAEEPAPVPIAAAEKTAPSLKQAKPAPEPATFATRPGATIVPIRAKTAQPAKGATSGDPKAYTSPRLSTPGEWVGEPMPVGSPLPTEAQKNVPPVKNAPAATTARITITSATTAPRMRSAPEEASEWVGEPMPVPPKAAAPEEAPSTPKIIIPRQTAPTVRVMRVSPATQNPATAEKTVASDKAVTENKAASDNNLPEKPQAEKAPANPVLTATITRESPSPREESREEEDAGSSIMDFIAGAAPIKKAAPPLASLIGEVSGPAPSAAPPAPSTPQATAPQSTPRPASEKAARNDARPPMQAPLGHSAAAPTEVAHQAAPQAAPQAAHLPQQGPDATIMKLVERLDAAMQDAQHAFQTQRAALAGEAAARIAAESEAFGFRVLARMARCVEQAAKANDMSALKDLLPELAVAVERNRIALSPRR